MNSENKPPKRIKQPSSYGNPRPTMDTRFFQIAKGWLGTTNQILSVIVTVMSMVTISLLVYTGIGITHSELYATDGSEFSCQLNSSVQERAR